MVCVSWRKASLDPGPHEVGAGGRVDAPLMRSSSPYEEGKAYEEGERRVHAWYCLQGPSDRWQKGAGVKRSHML